MMNGIVIRYVCLLILSLLLQTWNYLIRLSQELQLVSVLPRRFTDVGEQLDGGAIKQKRSDLKDADQYTTPGTYFVNLWGGVWQNMPTNDCFGLFEVRSYDGYITQRLSAGNGKVFVRIKEGEKPFKPWPTAAQ